MKIDLSGKSALVTGSTGGIGFAIARGLLEAGAAVVINGRTRANVDAALAVYLASPLASATTGAALRVDGGVVDFIN